jgi:hypothetical protein
VKIDSFMSLRAKTTGFSGQLNGLNGFPNSHGWKKHFVMINDRKIFALYSLFLIINYNGARNMNT